MSTAPPPSALASPGRLALRPAPEGLPDTDLTPPSIAESGDPFSAVRVLHLVARAPRGTAVRVDDLVSTLNAEHRSWLFSRAVVVDAILQLQANWMIDYRSQAGIRLDDGPYGPELTLEDSTRVDPWIVRQVARQVEQCNAALDEFARRDRPTGAD